MFPRLTPAVRAILLINILVYVASSMLGLDDRLSDAASLSTLGSPNFSPIQFITYMFLHGSFRHLFGNMLILFFFGSWLEQAWGTQRFLIFYLACGVGAGVLYNGVKYIGIQQMLEQHSVVRNHMTPSGAIEFLDDHGSPYMTSFWAVMSDYEREPENPHRANEAIQVIDYVVDLNIKMKMLGASGAVFGLLMALGLLFPNHTIQLLIPPIPIKVKYLVLVLGGIEFFAVLRPTAGDIVAHTAHLAGMLVAFLLIHFGNYGDNYYKKR